MSTTTAQEPCAMTTEQLDQFDQEGYVAVEGVLGEDILSKVIAELSEEVDARARELVASGELSQSFEEYPFETRLAKISAETDKVARSIWHGGLTGPAFFDLITYPRLLDVAEQLCGPELVASSVYRLRPKIPNYNYGAVPWHQDSGYFEPYCDNSLVLTVWVPLVDANVDNGCLWVLPGAHRGEVLKHVRHESNSYLLIPDDELPPQAEKIAIPVPVKKGGVLLMTNRTPHVSFENNTDIVRWSMDLRYQSAALPTNANFERLPSDSRANEDEGIPLACYPPEADFLVRSQLRPESVVQDAAEFHRLRREHSGPTVTNRW